MSLIINRILSLILFFWALYLMSQQTDRDFHFGVWAFFLTIWARTFCLEIQLDKLVELTKKAN